MASLARDLIAFPILSIIIIMVASYQFPTKARIGIERINP
jgi:hypothetical protein